MTQIEMLQAIEDIKRLKARYFHCVDTPDWSGFAGVFTQESVFDVRGGLEASGGSQGAGDEGILVGREAIVAFVRQALVGVRSIHFGSMPAIDILSADRAQGIWTMSDILIGTDGKPFNMLRGHGHYHETYVCRDHQWYIDELRLRRFRVTVE